MASVLLNRSELSQYSVYRAKCRELDKKIQEVEDEIEEINKYNISVSPILTGLPVGNERRDKIAEFVIKLEHDRAKLAEELELLVGERETYNVKMRRIRSAVNKVPSKQARDIIRRHFFDGVCAIKVANENHLTLDSVYKNINRYLSGSGNCGRAKVDG